MNLLKPIIGVISLGGITSISVISALPKKPKVTWLKGPFVIVNLKENSGQKLIVGGGSIFKPENKEKWIDSTDLVFYLVDKNYKQEYSFKEGNAEKAWIRTESTSTRALGWCFKEKSQCSSSSGELWEIKDLMFKFSFEGTKDEWWNMYISKCRSEYNSAGAQDQKESKCTDSYKTFEIEEVEF